MKIFWSWQSDTTGKIGRHLIRAALDEAVDQLKQERADVEEPSEREAKDAMHVDQDRQGVPGSPDLARLILDKIDAAAVVVADVTPVSTIPANAETGAPEKRNMNPNVAIELGYALRAVGDKNLLMVLNSHYGDRSYLPFDLAHKAGPLIFKLGPEADKDTILAVKKSLRERFVVALRAYLDSETRPTGAEHQRELHGASKATFYRPGQALAGFGDREDYIEFSMPDARGAYLRLIPSVRPPHPFTSGQLERSIKEGQGLATLENAQRGPLRTGNQAGAVSFDPIGQGPNIRSLTQVFKSGELWGVNRRILVNDERMGTFLPVTPFEGMMSRTIRRYAEFAANALALLPPYNIVAGVVGLRGYAVAVTDWQDNWFGPLHDDEFETNVMLNELTEAAFDKVVLAISKDLFALTGYPRPVQPGLLPDPDQQS